MRGCHGHDGIITDALRCDAWMHYNWCIAVWCADVNGIITDALQCDVQIPQPLPTYELTSFSGPVSCLVIPCPLAPTRHYYASQSTVRSKPAVVKVSVSSPHHLGGEDGYPKGTQRNNNVIMTSKRRRRFDVMMMLFLRRVSAAYTRPTETGGFLDTINGTAARIANFHISHLQCL